MKRVILLLAVLLTSAYGLGQDTGVGAPPFGSFTTGTAYDVINNQNLNVQFTVPITSSTGRGSGAFTFSEINNSQIWHPVASGASTSWTPTLDSNGNPTWGWQTAIPTGNLSSQWVQIGTCFGGILPLFHIYNFIFIDPSGTPHPFPTVDLTDTCVNNQVVRQPTAPGNSSAGYAGDASGFYVDSNATTATGTPAVIGPGGYQYFYGLWAKDPNGNLISNVGNSTTGTWVNSNGQTAATVTTGATAIGFSTPGGTTTVNLQNIAVQTNFGCAGIAEYSGTAAVPVSIVLPNGKSFSFAYESTPGTPSKFTGRLSVVTLPSGGTYSYTYTGPNDGINCANGTTMGLTRNVNDGTNTLVWKFVRSGSSTTLTAPKLSYDAAGNDVVFIFDANGREISRKTYQGSSSGGSPVLLRTTNTTWAANGTPATSVNILEDGATQSETDTTYNSNGFLQTISSYDFGNGAHGPLLKTISLTYLADSNANYAAPRNLINLVSEVQAKDGNGVIQNRVHSNYDENGNLTSCPTGVPQHDDTGYGCSFAFRGNLTSVLTYKDPLTPANPVSRNFTYDMFGNQLTSSLAGGQQTSATFSAVTNYSFPDSVTSGPPSGTQLTTSNAYLGVSGQIAFSTDANGQKTKFDYDTLGRIKTITRPDLSQISYSYDDVNLKTTVTTPVDSTHNVQEITAVDALGRTFTTTTADGSGNASSIVQNAYDEIGRLSGTSNAYVGAVTPLFTTIQFDALGRITKSVLPDGQQTTNSYSLQTVTSTDPTGKQVRNKVDALGRLIEVDIPGGGGAVATPGSGSASVNGTERSLPGTGATPSTGSATLSGSEQSIPGAPGAPATGTVTIGGVELGVPNCVGTRCVTFWDTGTVSIVVNGFTKSVNYGRGSTTGTIATALASALNGDSSSPVTASATGAVVTLTAKANGPNYPLSASSTTNDPADFAPGSFTATASGATLTGGNAGSATVFDSGTAWVTINNTQYTAAYNSSSTVPTLASALASAINTSSAIVTASASGGTVSIASKSSGAATNYSLVCGSATAQPASFSHPSFAVTCSGATMTGGQDGGPPLFDSGNVSLTVNGITVTAPYGSSSTSSSIASALTAALNASAAQVTASLSGSTINITASHSGASTNYSMSQSSSTSQPGSFSGASFALSLSGATLTGGANAGDPSMATPTVTTYAYNVMNQLTGVTMGAQSRTASYDALGRIRIQTTPEGGTVSTQFNDLNLLIQRTDARNVITNYTYDTLNRLTGRSYVIPNGSGVAASPNVCDPANGPTPTANVCLYYDQGGAAAFALGQLTSVSDPSGSETLAYNQMGRITQRSKIVTGANNGAAYVTQYQYNLAGTLTLVQYPSGRQVTSTFDALGRLAGIADASTSYATNFAYNTAQQITGFNYGNGITATYGYSLDGRLQLNSLSFANAQQTLLSLKYGYTQNGGNNGQITSIVDNIDNGRTITYSYDALARLREAYTAGSTAFPKWNLAFAYDNYGNRTDETPQSDTSPNASVPSTHITVSAATNRITTAGYAYDAAGNTTNDGLNVIVYDGEGQVASSSSGAASTAYISDSGGLRVRKCQPNCSAPASSTVYIFSGNNLIAEYDNGAVANSPSREYIYSPTGLLATIDSTGTRYHLNDHLSPRVTTSAAGAKVGEQGTFPFGESWYSANTATKFRFTSYENDPESGNDYAMARYYINRLCRFSSPDPLRGSILDPKSLNRYAYVQNDPINNVDPLGLKGTCNMTVQVMGGNLTSNQIEGMMAEMNRIFGTGGADIHLNVIAYPGPSDFTLAIESRPVGPLGRLGNTPDIPGISSTIYTANIDNVNRIVQAGANANGLNTVYGRIGVHEMAGHGMLGIRHESFLGMSVAAPLQGMLGPGENTAGFLFDMGPMGKGAFSLNAKQGALLNILCRIRTQKFATIDRSRDAVFIRPTPASPPGMVTICPVSNESDVPRCYFFIMPVWPLAGFENPGGGGSGILHSPFW
jgi:RHS repeat-associated protein